MRSNAARGHQAQHPFAQSPRRFGGRTFCSILTGAVVVAVTMHYPCPVASAASAGPEAQLMGKARIDPRLGDRVPLDLEFQNSSGETINLEGVFTSRPVILHLVYYQCPMLCRLSADGLLDGLDGLDLSVGEQFDVITLSFDPREGVDLASRARRLALDQYGRATAGKGWHFLTGNSENIQRITEAVGFYPVWDDATGQYAHPSGIFVLTSDGMVSRYLSGIEFRPRDLRLAVVEASEGRVGSISDQLLMLCYQYDPTTGRYGFAIISALRASGLLTVVVLVCAIVIMVRRERRKQSTETRCE